MDPTKIRMRYLLGIFLAAVVTAAALRHFFTFKSALPAKRFAREV
jgi:hypothetical protein